MLPMLAIGWQTSALRGEEAGVSIVVVSGVYSTTDTLTIESRVALNTVDREILVEYFVGGLQRRKLDARKFFNAEVRIALLG